MTRVGVASDPGAWPATRVGMASDQGGRASDRGAWPVTRDRPCWPVCWPVCHHPAHPHPHVLSSHGAGEAWTTPPGMSFLSGSGSGSARGIQEPQAWWQRLLNLCLVLHKAGAGQQLPCLSRPEPTVPGLPKASQPPCSLRIQRLSSVRKWRRNQKTEECGGLGGAQP